MELSGETAVDTGVGLDLVGGIALFLAAREAFVVVTGREPGDDADPERNGRILRSISHSPMDDPRGDAGLDAAHPVRTDLDVPIGSHCKLTGLSGHGMSGESSRSRY